MDKTDANFQGISIIIPMYNEEDAIANVLDSLLGVLSALTLPYEVIVVDDGSNDYSSRIVSDFPVRLIKHARNLGYGKALKSGISVSQYEYIIFVDADGQHDVVHIPAFAERILHYDAVIGQRKMGNTHRMSRFLGKLFLRASAYIFLGIKIADLNCGFRAFRKSVIKKYLHLLPNGFSASMTSTLIVIFRRYQIEYIPLTISRRLGKSTLREIKDGFKAFNQILRMAMLFIPWRIFGSVGFILIAGGMFYGVDVYFKTKGFPASAVMAISTGVSSIFFGLLMDQIAEIRKERFED